MKETLKINYVKGCHYDVLEIDRKSSSNMTDEELKDAVKRLIDSIGDRKYLEQLMIEYLEYNGTVVHSYDCPCCGDVVQEFEIDI